MTAKCQVCHAPSPNAYLCHDDQTELHRILDALPWLLDRLAETAVGQARLGEPGIRGHRSGLERYSDPKPAIDGQGTEGQRRLAQDLDDQKLRNRLLAQGGVNARASDLFDEVQNMLGGWARDVCERRGLYWIPDPTFIGPLLANEMRFAPRTAARMALWLTGHVSAISAADSAGETFRDVRKAEQDMVRAVNRPPEPKTCGPCPTLGHHHEKDGKPVFTVDVDSRVKCGTRLEAREGAKIVRCPVCAQDHEVDYLTEKLLNDMHWMSFTIKQLLDVVLPKADEHIPRRTLYDWARKEYLKPTGHDANGKPKYLLADIRRLRADWFKQKAA